ncbi:MAG: YbgC/FadM family acyl-CoA thioesterase [Alphaproteobacteria bacterium]
MSGQDHRFPVRVYYEDTDFSGFVYHANYLKFFERGRSEALWAAGVSHRDLLAWEPPSAMVVRHMEIDFERPARIEDELLVHTRFVSLRGARMFLDQRLERAGEIIATARLEIVLITLAGRPRRIPEALATALSSLIGD